MLLSINGNRRKFTGKLVPLTIVSVLLLFVLASGEGFAKSQEQKTFSSPKEAVKAMVEAMQAGQSDQLAKVFGTAGRELFFSGDEAIDRETREEFLRAYNEKNRLEAVGKNKAILHVGKEDWSWPIPIVRPGKGWFFDTKEGRKEILARRIGENELSTIQVCLAYVDAQREYAQGHQSGLKEYAQKFASDPGKMNGLCWEEKNEGRQSPLGPFLVEACSESYPGANRAAALRPYHGYLYRILRKQGKEAPGGEYDYVVDGKMIGGFALVAYPAQYGSSGVMTFIVNQDGVVYQKDLGKNTEKLAGAMDTFDPDKTWKRVD